LGEVAEMFCRITLNPISVLIPVKWSLTGSEKQKKISNFELLVAVNYERYQT